MHARSMENKEVELEVYAQLQGCILIGVTKMWWEDSHDWCAATDK